jgi:hypothetical protein
MGITVNVPNFGEHIQNYIDNTTHQAQSTVIDYPETGLNGLNLLNTTDSVYAEWDFHSLVANRPNDCLSLKLVIEKSLGIASTGVGSIHYQAYRTGTSAASIKPHKPKPLLVLGWKQI